MADNMINDLSQGNIKDFRDKVHGSLYNKVADTLDLKRKMVATNIFDDSPEEVVDELESEPVEDIADEND
jgi:hypothetical protein